ncbi:ribonuclease Z [Flavobacteriaceae bacterium]|nr:ribonuclease Z [Flavobacteriaceae bacterium]MDB0043301.1 ribonuclease Z [Flavobacteriaceae bacterium]MDB4050599.1 ribonuclease Z [Flavobacteriaceae bacterium]MDB4086743.1 ribonuclease Z [Flavobacteriaceae bacterium]MDB4240428.1 ribonuclease Z [Flavobacteriaceae bacterium]
MKLTILGSFSAYPSFKGFTTSQVLEHNGKSFLIDCGEGTQLQLRKNKIKFNSIEDVFISHLHGDHYFGLPGLILTFNLLGREKPLNIFGPKGIKEIITSLMKVGKTWTNYKLNFIELNSIKPQDILNKNNFTVTTIPLYHGIYTNGFLFRKKTTSHKLIMNKAIDLGIDKTQFAAIKLGKDGVTSKGEIIKNTKLVEPLSPDIIYAFCSDTLFNLKITEQISECDLLYHESTFLKKDENFAVKTFHSTAEQAAIIAKNSNVKKLILGHFSTRYNDLDLFLNEAKTVFENCELAIENKSFIF